MNPRAFSLGLVVASLALPAAFAQSSAQIAKSGAVKDAGIYHVATGTWSRASQLPLGVAPTAYDNTAPSGFFGNMDHPMVWYDSGALPSTGRMGCVDQYAIDGFQVGYCSYEGPAGTALTFDFYQALGSCQSPTGLTPTAAFSATGPGSAAAGTEACWTLTFDLSGTSLAFVMDADGDQVFDGSLAQDTFTWGFGMWGTVGTGGPLIAGDPGNAPFGDGTYYQNPGAPLGGTGLDQRDQFWLFDPSSTYFNGCRFFGGYAPGTPWAGFHLRLLSSSASGCGQVCGTYCSSTPNSTGAPALISSTDGCDADGDGVVSLQASPVPNHPGIFFHGTLQLSAPFGCGLLCTAGTVTRGAVVFATGNTANYDFDAASVGIAPGDGYFQYWYRDPAHSGACGNYFNTSDALIY